MATKTIIEGKTPSRDEAAALAMAGILAAGGHRDKNGSYDFESMAVSATTRPTRSRSTGSARAPSRGSRPGGREP